MAYHPGINAAIYCHSSELPCMSGSITSLHTSLLPFVSLLLFTSCSPYPFYTPFLQTLITDNPMPEKRDPIAQLVTHSLYHNKKLLICIFNLDGSLKTNKQNIIWANMYIDNHSSLAICETSLKTKGTILQICLREIHIPISWEIVPEETTQLVGSNLSQRIRKSHRVKGIH